MNVILFSVFRIKVPVKMEYESHLDVKRPDPHVLGEQSAEDPVPTSLFFRLALSDPQLHQRVSEAARREPPGRSRSPHLPNYY